MKHNLSLVLILTLAVVTLFGQSTSFVAKTDANKVLEGSYVQVSFILENGNGSRFKPPSFKGFQVVSGPSSSNSTTIVNGRRSQTISYTYGLQPTAVGRFTIGPATMVVNGKKMTTNSLIIEVVKGSKKQGVDNQQVFVKMELTDSIAYVGQQIIVDYKLYTQLDVRSIDFTTEQKYDGFYSEQLKRERSNYTREIIGDQEYHVKSISKMALFPQQTGTYDLDPASIKLGIATEGRSRSFFFSAQLKPMLTIANGARITVKAIPTATTAATGAVGRYSMKVSTEKRSITTDEAITVLMQIIGNGDNKTVQPPKWPLPKGLEMYDPNVIEDEVFKSKDQITHRKTFEYLIVAKQPGTYILNPQFTYFNVDSSAYTTLENKLPRVTVLKGSNTPLVIENDELELAENYDTTTLHAVATSHYNSPLHLGLLGIILAAVIGIFGYGRQLSKSGKLDPAIIRKKKAYELANNRLKKAHEYLERNESKAFHEEMILAIKNYLTDKYKVPALHLKKDQLIDRLSTDTDLDANSISQLKEILYKSEQAMYAPGLTSDLRYSYDAAATWISQAEN